MGGSVGKSGGAGGSGACGGNGGLSYTPTHPSSRSKALNTHDMQRGRKQERMPTHERVGTHVRPLPLNPGAHGGPALPSCHPPSAVAWSHGASLLPLFCTSMSVPFLNRCPPLVALAMAFMLPAQLGLRLTSSQPRWVQPWLQRLLALPYRLAVTHLTHCGGVERPSPTATGTEVSNEECEGRGPQQNSGPQARLCRGRAGSQGARVHQQHGAHTESRVAEWRVAATGACPLPRSHTALLHTPAQHLGRACFPTPTLTIRQPPVLCQRREACGCSLQVCIEGRH